MAQPTQPCQCVPDSGPVNGGNGSDTLSFKAELGISGIATDETMGKVSIVGAGMKTHPGVAARVFTVLGEHGINIEMISTSPIKISCVIPGDRVPDAVRALHGAFELSGDDTIRPEQPFGQFAS